MADDSWMAAELDARLTSSLSDQVSMHSTSSQDLKMTRALADQGVVDVIVRDVQKVRDTVAVTVYTLRDDRQSTFSRPNTPPEFTYQDVVDWLVPVLLFNGLGGE